MRPLWLTAKTRPRSMTGRPRISASPATALTLRVAGQIVGPYRRGRSRRAARTSRPSCRPTTTISPLDRGAGAAEQPGGFRNAVMRPQAAAVIGRQHVELVLDGDREDPAIGDGRRRVHRRRDVLPPDHLAVGRIERQDLARSRSRRTAGRSRSTARRRMRCRALPPASDRPAQMRPPVAASSALTWIAAVHRDRPGRRRRPAATAPGYSATSPRRCWSSRRAASRSGSAGWPHRMRRIAAGLGPVRVDRRRRQRDRGCRPEPGRARARRRCRAPRSARPAAASSSRRTQPHPAAEASSSAAKSRRFIRLIRDSRNATGTPAGLPLRISSAATISAARARRPLRRRQIVGELLIDVERAAAVARLELGRRSQVERARAPWVAARGQRREPLDRGLADRRRAAACMTESSVARSRYSRPSAERRRRSGHRPRSRPGGRPPWRAARPAEGGRGRRSRRRLGQRANTLAASALLALAGQRQRRRVAVPPGPAARLARCVAPREDPAGDQHERPPPRQ